MGFLGVVLMLMPILRPAAANIIYITLPEYVATQLCEQKDIPDNCCQGSCYVPSQIENGSDSDKEGWLAGILSLEEWQPMQIIMGVDLSQKSLFDLTASRLYSYSLAPLLGYADKLLRPPITPSNI